MSGSIRRRSRAATAVLQRHMIAYLIRDLGSRNGVRVNGRLQEEARLHSGDELAIGPILFRLEEEVEQAARRRPVGAAPRSSPGPGCEMPRPRLGQAAASVADRTRMSILCRSTTSEASQAWAFDDLYGSCAALCRLAQPPTKLANFTRDPTLTGIGIRVV